LLSVFCFAVETYSGLSSSDGLVLGRNGSVVEAHYGLIKCLAAEKETLMVLAPGQCWTGAVAEVSKLETFVCGSQ
jgi:hypothetical protein